MTELSEHFSLEEMIASQEGARRGIDNTPPANVLNHLTETCTKLEAVRELLGHPITVSSGYRCPALNAAIGGAANSAHMFGYAVDFICPAFGVPLAVCSAIEKSGLQYDQLIHEFGNWTHLSFDPQMRRQSLTIFKGSDGYLAGLIASPSANKIV
ncbi:MAG TPA: D-Ala-D-Ala carboxypeptidase family metallohydrolase [Micropepsaceae bacterium]|nr:D-Ala-D-Ala carboxypeptidase family metallohydrolase [Micropepsaceae bacterium]